MIGAGIRNKKRQAVYRRDGWRCALCDSQKYIQIHHVVKRSEGGGDEMQNLITLCSDCHALVHGTDLRGCPDATPEAAAQAIIEYMAEHYAEQGMTWNPWNKDYERIAAEAWADEEEGP